MIKKKERIYSLICFANEINGKFIFDYDLKKTNWFNIGGKAKAYFKPESLNELSIFLKKFGSGAGCRSPGKHHLVGPCGLFRWMHLRFLFTFLHFLCLAG